MSATHNSYREDLPDSCPPAEAAPPPSSDVYRLVATDTPTEEDFYSHAKLGKKKKPSGVCECRWASCSVYDASSPKGYAQVVNLTKIPALRDRKYVALVTVDEKSGETIKSANGSSHIDLWMYEDFDPVGAVGEITEIKK